MYDKLNGDFFKNSTLPAYCFVDEFKQKVPFFAFYEETKSQMIALNLLRRVCLFLERACS